MELAKLVEKAIDSQLFSSPVLASHLERFLNDEGARIEALAQRFLDEKVEHIYCVGSGNSWVNLAPGKYILDKFTHITSDVYVSYEFVWRNPAR